MMDIPKEVVQTVASSNEIPDTVAEMSQEIEAPEINPYMISFARYNNRMCEISNLSGNKGRKAVETLKTIGTKIRSEADFQRNSIDRIPVCRDGAYKPLFNGLGEDIELKEIKLQSSGRIFYFDIESERVFYVVAIRENHLETDKVRR